MANIDYRRVSRAGHWLDVRRRRLRMWAYAINRITSVGLVIYLYLHLGVLSLLTRGQSSWDSFVSLARSPFYLALDVILLAGVLLHGLNGLRIAVTGFGIGVRAQKTLFIVLTIVSAIALGVAALKIFHL